MSKVSIVTAYKIVWSSFGNVTSLDSNCFVSSKSLPIYCLFNFQVASRHVYICAGLLYILFGIVGKFSAAIITIPSPVLGGAAIIMFSTFLGVALSNLQVTVDSLRPRTNAKYVFLLAVKLNLIDIIFTEAQNILLGTRSTVSLF